MKKSIIAISTIALGLIVSININNNTVLAKNKSSIQQTTDELNQIKNELNKKDAEELLKKYNPNIEYIYQGDANEFEALREQNLNGYVYLPNVDGDLGYFIDKHNSKIYHFHPSGYLESIK